MSFEQAERGYRESPPKSLDGMWSRWNETIGLDSETFALLWHDSEQDYIDLPFHNFSHAVDVTWRTLEIVDDLKKHGIEVYTRSLVVSGFKHDSGYHKNHQVLGFDSKEELSRKLFIDSAPKYGLTGKEIRIGAQAIMATKVGTVPKTVEDKALRLADMDNVGDRYESFFHRTKLFHQELERLTGTVIPFRTVARASVEKLSDYFSDEVNFGYDVVKNGRSAFEIRAISNIVRLVKDIAIEEEESPLTVAHSLGPIVLRVLGFRRDY
jgi:hypothetical protein